MAFQNISIQVTANVSQYTSAMRRAAKVTRELGAAGTAARSQAAAGGRMGQVLNQHAKGANMAAREMGRYNGALGIGSRAMQAFEAAGGGVQGILAGIGTTAGQTVAALTGFITIHAGIQGISKLFRFARESVLEFDKALTESMAILDDDEFNDAVRMRFEEAAKDVSTYTTFSPGEVSEGFYHLISAGLDAEASLEAVGVAARFAQAGVMDLEKATELLMDVQAALGQRSEDAETNAQNLVEITDLITQAAIDSTASIEEFGEMITNKFGVSAQLAGQTTESVLAIGEAYARVGIKGRIAGTYGQMFLRDIQTNAIKNADVLDKLGVTVFDANGNMRDMVEIAKELSIAFDGMSDRAMRLKLLDIGFTDRAVQATLPLIAQSAAQYDKDMRSLNASAGKTAEIAERQLESLTNKAKMFGNAISRVSKQISDMGIGALANTIKRIEQPVLDAWEALKKFSQETLLPGIRPMATLIGGALLTALSAFANTLKFTAQIAESLGPILKPLITLLLAYKAALMIRSGAQTIFTAKGARPEPPLIAGREFANPIDPAEVQRSGTAVRNALRQMNTNVIQTGGVFKGLRLTATQAMDGVKSKVAAAKTSVQSSMASMSASAFAVNAALMAITVGAGIAMDRMAKERSEMQKIAHENLEEITGGFTTDTDLSSLESNLEALRSARDETMEVALEYERTHGLLGEAIDNIFSLDSGRAGREALTAVGDLAEETQAAQGRVNNVVLNSTRVLSEMDRGYAQALLRQFGSGRAASEEISRVANRLNIDLTKTGEAGEQNRRKLIEYFDGMVEGANRAGYSLGEFASLSSDAQDEISSNMEAIGESFREAFAELYDPSAAVENLLKFKASIKGAYGGFGDTFSDLQKKVEKTATETSNATTKAYDREIRSLERRRRALEKAATVGRATSHTRESRARRQAALKELQGVEEQLDAVKEKRDLEKERLEIAKEAEDARRKASADETPPPITLSQWINELSTAADKSRAFEADLKRLKERLAEEGGISYGFANAIVEEIAEMGPRAMPLVEELASAVPERFKAMATEVIEAFKQMSEAPKLTLDDLKQAQSEMVKDNEQYSRALLVLSNRLSRKNLGEDVGLSSDDLQRFFTLNPAYRDIMVEMMLEIDKPGGESKANEFAQLVKNTLENHDFEKTIPDKIAMAMEMAAGEAANGATLIGANIDDGLRKMMPDILETIERLGLRDLLDDYKELLSLTPEQVTNARSLLSGAAAYEGHPGNSTAKPGDQKDKKGPPTIDLGSHNGKNVPKDFYNYSGPWSGLKKGDIFYDSKGKKHKVGSYAEGGIHGPLPKQAKIQPAKPGGGLINWAEPETGGEAYIPLAQSKRSRSVDILNTVAKKFGYSLTKFAQGGLRVLQGDEPAATAEQPWRIEHDREVYNSTTHTSSVVVEDAPVESFANGGTTSGRGKRLQGGRGSIEGMVKNVQGHRLVYRRGKWVEEKHPEYIKASRMATPFHRVRNGKPEKFNIFTNKWVSAGRSDVKATKTARNERMIAGRTQSFSPGRGWVDVSMSSAQRDAASRPIPYQRERNGAKEKFNIFTQKWEKMLNGGIRLADGGVVGIEGPELFRPVEDGRIIPKVPFGEPGLGRETGILTIADIRRVMAGSKNSPLKMPRTAQRPSYSAPRALGGPVTAGKTYLVGERRPELFMPSRPSGGVSRGPSGSPMVGGGVFNPGSVQVIPIPVPIETKNETNFGDIRGVSIEEAVAYAERKKRQRRLTGGKGSRN